MGYLGHIEYLVTAQKMTWHLRESIDAILPGSRHVPTTFRIHLDTENVDRRAQSYLDVYPERVVVTSWGHAGSRGPAAVRNKLARDSVADYLVFVDSDVILPPHFDTNLREYLAQTDTNGILYPRILGRFNEPGPSHFFQEYVMAPKVFSSGAVAITSAVFGISSQLWRSLPDFDEEFVDAGGEDWKFFRDVQMSPHEVPVRFTERLVAHHDNPRNLETLLRRAERYGRQAHLHTTPPPRIRDRLPGPRRIFRVSFWMKDVPGQVAKLSYRFLLFLNRWVATWAHGGAGARLAAQTAIGLRDLVFGFVSALRRDTPPDRENDEHLLMVERIRYSSLLAKIFPGLLRTHDPLAHGGALPAAQSFEPPSHHTASNDPFGTRGRSIHSERHTVWRRPSYFLIRLQWSREYWRFWREGHAMASGIERST